MRLGPVCEAILNGKYYWIPFERLSRVDIEAPSDLRDLIWAPVERLAYHMQNKAPDHKEQP